MKPVFFKQNRVGRVYTGGKLFEDFFGGKSEDNFFPEEWIASSVEAINEVSACRREGVSVCESGEYFDELLSKYPEEMLGEAGKMRILVKILDSAVRLPAQAHPDKEFSKKHFNSPFGKTESWIVLGTRPGARIYFGFKDGVTKEVFEKAIDDSLTDKDAMERLMEYIEPKVGDVFLVPARTVHAIGAGCLILEIQEPTDFTIQPEHWCDGYRLNDREMYIGLSKDTAIECFDFGKAPDTRMIPEVISEGNGVKYELVIGEKNTDCFVVNRVTLDGGSFTPDLSGTYGVYIVTEGSGVIEGEGYSREIKKGDYFFIPACCMGKFAISGNVTITECY